MGTEGFSPKNDLWTFKRGSGSKIILALIMSILSIFVYWQVDGVVVDAKTIIDEETDYLYGNVIEVIDGDTIKLGIGHDQYVIRLIGLDAPERGECYYEEASNALEQMLLYRNVTIETDETQDKVDRYDRVLGYVIADETNASEEMILGGYAREYTYDKPYKYLDDFKDAESIAQDGELGIWGAACN